ncbi:MAG: hypothetical protein J4G18_07900 [Anaerolineae bacterium]|nr:hypothetical protein [Anaerolineae bacterium]
MKQIKYKIVQDSRAVVFQPSEKRVTYLDGKDSPLLKRRIPKRPQQNPEPPKRGENDD